MDREEYRYLKINQEEHGIMLNALVGMRNQVLSEDRDSSPVDELLLKVIDAPHRPPRRRGHER